MYIELYSTCLNFSSLRMQYKEILLTPKHHKIYNPDT